MRWLRPADAIVVAGAVMLVAAVAIAAWTPSGPAEWVEIRTPYGAQRVTLSENATLDVRGRLGDSVVEVRSGRVRFADAPCRNRVCIAAGWLARSGDFAACAPNGVSVQVQDAAMRYDAVAY